jgi:hypothetical protein
LFSYLFEIGAFQHKLRMYDQPDPPQAQAQPAADPGQPPAAQPQPNANNDNNGNNRANGQPLQQQQQPQQARQPGVRMSWSRYIARRLRGGVGLPTTPGIFFDIISFFVALIASLVPEWNPYGHMHV